LISVQRLLQVGDAGKWKWKLFRREKVSS